MRRPKPKRRRSATPPEPASYDSHDPYDAATTLPPRPSRTRAKSGQSSSFSVLPIIAVFGVLLLLGGAGFGVWKLVQMIPEDFGESKFLLGQPRGQFGPFTLDIPESASKAFEKEFPFEEGYENMKGNELRQLWNAGANSFFCYYYDFDILDRPNDDGSIFRSRITTTAQQIEWWADNTIHAHIDFRANRIVDDVAWSDPVELQVNGTIAATMTGRSYPERNGQLEVNAWKVFYCRVGNRMIAVMQMIPTNKSLVEYQRNMESTLFAEFDAFVGTLKHKSDEPTAE